MFEDFIGSKSQLNGQFAEDLFDEEFDEILLGTKKTSRRKVGKENDKVRHFDRRLIGDLKIDIKYRKDRDIFPEIINTGGTAGSLFGDSNYMGFYCAAIEPDKDGKNGKKAIWVFIKTNRLAYLTGLLIIGPKTLSTKVYRHKYKRGKDITVPLKLTYLKKRGLLNKKKFIEEVKAHAKLENKNN